MATDKVTRKLTTILAADVEGYTRLMRADEEATLKTFGEYRETIDTLVARHEGRVFSTGGDSVMAEFGSAVEAVRCAISWQEEIASRNAALAEDRKMMFRIGVNVGDVMVREDDLFGDGVNVAARLEGLAPPGGVCVSSSVFEQVKHKLSLGFEDMGPQEVKNIAEPVSAYRLVPGSVAVAAAAKAPSSPARWRMPALAAALAAVIVVAGVAFWRPWAPSGGPTVVAHKLSIVVLPFTNLSDDTKQDYFADAITEDLISDLSRIRGAFVIARGTSFTYKGKAVKAKTVAQQLKVRYVLEGSVRRLGDQVRINAQLIDGKSGAHIWSAKFDRAFKNVFALQSEITGRIAAVLKVELLEAESRQSERGRPANLKAWDYAVQGHVKMHRLSHGPGRFANANALFAKALKLDPNLALAWEGVAFIHYVAATRKLPGITGPHRKLALEAAQKAVALDPRSSGAHTVLGLAYVWVRRPDRGLSACERSLNLNRNNDDAYIFAAQALRALGKSAEAIRMLEKSRQLNPRFSPWRRHMLIGANRVLLGEYDKAQIALNKAKAEFPTHQIVNMYLASALALSGRMEQARKALSEYLKLVGEKRNTIEKVRANLKHISPDIERILEGLRRAGMPER